ncbi:endonuclease III [Candidatus Woesearchaeota archaeon]|nr:endonuclease III [Candidatus Woesearchaeota archaeon]
MDAARILRLLKTNYVSPRTALRFRTPIQMLVSTMLSAQCTDATVNRVTSSLFKKYGTVDDFAKASIRDFESDIRPTGFYRSKAANIIAAASLIVQNHKGKVPDNVEDLIALPGIGRKTANIVLWNSFGIISGVAVDTHVRRVSYRLGLTNNTDAEKIEKDLQARFKKEDWPHLSNLLIAHGRSICQARRPLCRQCFLFNLCERNGVDRKFWG